MATFSVAAILLVRSTLKQTIFKYYRIFINTNETMVCSCDSMRTYGTELSSNSSDQVAG